MVAANWTGHLLSNPDATVFVASSDSFTSSPAPFHLLGSIIDEGSLYPPSTVPSRSPQRRRARSSSPASPATSQSSYLSFAGVMTSSPRESDG